jgi:hypothetical protein
VTAMTRAECEHLGCLATPEQIADAYAKTGIPTAPDVRPAADELRPIPDKPSNTVENAALALGLATVAAVLAGVLS